MPGGWMRHEKHSGHNNGLLAQAMKVWGVMLNKS